jgi:hypothetical protein
MQQQLFIDDDKVKNLQNTIDYLNGQLRNSNKIIKKYETRILKLESLLQKEKIVESPIKYVMSKYKKEYDLILKILNKHNVMIFNKKVLCSRIILALEGDKEQLPTFSVEKLDKYLNLIDSYSLNEYRKIKFAPIIKSDKSIFENYEQIVSVLKRKRNNVNDFDFSVNSVKIIDG